MFLNKADILIFLSTSRLEIYGQSLKEGDRIEFPKDIYDQSELKDPEKFKEIVVELLARTGLKKQTVVIVLSDKLIFEKRGQVKTQEDKDVLLNEFENNLPQGKNIAKLEILEDKELSLFASGEDIYSVVVEAVRAVEWEVLAVSPLSIFKLGGGDLTDSEVSKILSSRSIFKVANFLSSHEPETKSKTGSFLTPLLLVGLILVLIGGIFAARSYLNSVRQNKPTVMKVVNLPKPTSSTASSSAVPSLSKEDLKVQVLNGSGVTGQAGKVATSLKDLGYPNVVTGNANPGNGDTLLETTASVSAQEKQEISETLQKSFKTIKQDQLVSGTFDIVIITGDEVNK